MPVVFSALMCHAPIVVPAVGGERARQCVRTTRAMREVAARMVASRPDRLVLPSPHTPRRRAQWTAQSGPHRGDLSRFGAPDVTVSLPDAPDVAAHLGLVRSPPAALDHGAMVPLSFLVEAGWRGPTAVLALPWDETGAEELGRRLVGLEGRTAVVASGDMSHRLAPGAPGGFHPDARAFDDAFVAALSAERWDAELPHREDAAEDVVTSCRLATAAAAGLNAEVLAYEGPWGVGYCEAVFHDAEPPLWAVARRAVEAAVTGRGVPSVSGGPLSAGVFVTLTRDGELRGCIGRTSPACTRLFEEIVQMGIAAATQDPRMQPVRQDELPFLDIEVSVLQPPEPCTLGELDPRVYGVIVACGRRRGLLLPDLDGVDDVDHQVAIARQKGRIGSDEPVTLSRFTVHKTARP